MLYGKREPRSAIARRRAAYRPIGEDLEARRLLAIDLGGTTPPNLPNIATVPFGVEMVGGNSSGGAGFSVAAVGDVNLDGFGDFVIGSPTVITSSGVPVVGNGGNSSVYLVFGSQGVDLGTVNWLLLNAQQRVGDLNQLGNSGNTQQNPFNNISGFPFRGIRLFTSLNPNSQLGASVESVVVNGVPSILIGAPGAADLAGNQNGAGRAYLIYGGAALNNVPTTSVDLDTLGTGNSGLTVLTFATTVPGAGLGTDVAGVNAVINATTNTSDLAISAPTATIPGSGLPNAGLVFLVNGTALPTVTSVIDVLTVGQAAGQPGVIFAGQSANDLTGFSVASAPSVAGTGFSDLLIGAPSRTGAGTAYLVYGGTSLPGLATTTAGVNFIALSRLGIPGGVPGAIFQGTGAGALAGFSVASAGDFNQDGLGDFLIGSPGGGDAGQGQVNLFYGQPANGTPISGTIPLGDIPTTAPGVTFTGGSQGDLVGFALDRYNPFGILVGAPGFNNGSGAVYLIPNNLSLFGDISLTAAESQPVAATLITASLPGSSDAGFFGASVSGRVGASADGDAIPDFIVGAPGYALNQTRTLAGAAFMLEGAFVPIQTPVDTSFTISFGVGQPNPPFVVNPTTPAELQFFVNSDATSTPPFNPVTDIDPTTITVNGVAFPDAVITANPVDVNNDGIPDAIITITPRANIGLTNRTTSITLAGRTLPTAALPNAPFTGTVPITVSGGGGGGGGGGTASFLPPGFLAVNQVLSPIGERLVPDTTELSRFNYKAIPLGVAVNQFKPSRGFLLRQRNFFSKDKVSRVNSGGVFDSGRGTYTLAKEVYSRGTFHPGKKVRFTHPVRVVPTYRQTERFS